MSSSPPLGVLLTNLGTPDAPTAKALRRYLGEFLWDPRVVDLPRPLWWLILHGVILRVRPARSAANYRKVWREDGSPLLAISRRQQQLLQQQLDARVPHPTHVALGMRYGNPSIAAALDELRQAGCQQIVALPLYPQFSCSTTASTFDAIAAAWRKQRDLPALRLIRNYHLDSGYLDALAASVEQAWSAQPAADKLLISFHGTPERFRDSGDPYYGQCVATAEALAQRLALPPERWQLTFQSRFGREPWLQPYTDKTLEALPGQGVRSVDLICPGFSADCLETLEEIEGENREIFEAAGGERFRYIHALNDRPEHIDALAQLVIREAWCDAIGCGSCQERKRCNRSAGCCGGDGN